MDHSTLLEHIEKVRYFVVIADELSFARAARKLRRSQPTLSYSIRMLESVVNAKLFARTARGLELTPAGQTLFAFGKRLVEETRLIEKTLQNSSSRPKQITIGMKESHAVALWSKYMDLFHLSFTELKFQLRAERSNEVLIRQLQRDELDLAILPEPRCEGWMTTYRLFSDTLGFYCSPQFYSYAILPPYEAPLYCVKDAILGMGETVATTLGRDPQLASRIADVNSFSVAQSLAIEGKGIAVLNELAASELVRRTQLIPISHSVINPRLFPKLWVYLSVNSRVSRDLNLRLVRKALTTFHGSDTTCVALRARHEMARV